MVTMAIFVLLLNAAGNPHYTRHDKLPHPKRLLMIDPKGKIWQSRDGVTWTKLDAGTKKQGLVLSIESPEDIEDAEL